jgi:hypothetical protein
MPAEKEQHQVADAVGKLSTQAQQLVASWTRGLENVTFLKLDAGSVIIVSKDENAAYHVTAFFTIGDTWTASADAQAVTADEAFKELARRMS